MSRKLSPIEIVKRAKHDGLWEDGSNFSGNLFEKNNKGQMFHEWISEKQSLFVTEVEDDEDYLGNKSNQNKDE
jgi:hypothetical protein|tara:strand:- start:256 stop:474 length:219 start_codon:yes stop_codon:yes gene_type:complete